MKQTSYSVKYTIVSGNVNDVLLLKQHCAPIADLLVFSDTIPVIRISGIDAIYNTVMGYESWVRGLGRDFREEFRQTVVRTSTSEMRARGLPPYVVVGRLLTEEELLTPVDTYSSLFASVADAVEKFNAAQLAPAISNVAILADHLTPPDGDVRDLISVLDKALRMP